MKRLRLKFIGFVGWYLISAFLLMPVEVSATMSVKDSILTFETAADYYQELNAQVKVSHTPVPSFVKDVRCCRLTLNGKWYFTEKVCDGFERLAGPQKDWHQVDVPSEWYMQSFEVERNHWAGYYREFTLPDDWKGKNVLIRFGAVQSECKIFLNGHFVGSHAGAMTQFEKDLTPFLIKNVNRLVLYVRSESFSDESSKISHYAKHQVGGILRSVELVALPVRYIQSLLCDALLDNKLSEGSLHYALQVNRRKKGKLRIVVRERGIEGLVRECREVFRLETDEEEGVIKLDNPFLWHAECPFLYTVEFSLLENGVCTETVSRNVGFRKIEVRGNSLYVNGRQIKLHGVARHDITAYGGRAVSDTALLAKDIKQLRDANCNFIRTSHYPPDEYMLDLCDRYGIFIEDEAPVCWDNFADTQERATSLFYCFKSLLYRDRSHPCVLLWSIANESRWNARFYPCLLLAREETPHIPVKFSHSEFQGIKKGTDIGAKHYPGWQGLLRYDNYFRPMLFGEALHVNCYNTSETMTDPALRDLWGDYIKYFVDNMQESPAIAGLGIWGAVDEMFYPKGHQPCGYGPWGVLDGFRREKPEFWHMKMAYSPVVITARHFQQADGEILLPVESRYNYITTGKLDFVWEDGKTRGVSHVDIHPMEQGTLRIPHVMQGDTLVLTIRDCRGFELSKWKIPRKYTSHYPVPQLAVQSEVKVETNDSLYVIKGKYIETWFDRKRGILKSVFRNGKNILSGGLKMYLIPLAKENEVIDYIPQEPVEGVTVGFMSAPLEDWTFISEQMEKLGNVVSIKVKGKYGNLPVEFVYFIDGVGRIRIDYLINLKAMDFKVRQIGIGFDISREYDTFEWKRKSLWSYYPQNHIGRPQGEAKAFYPETLSDYLHNRVVPAHAYALDGNKYGSNDFRSTKHNLISGRYKHGNEVLLEVESNGRQHIRSWVNNGMISFLVANYSNGGNEHYLNYDSDRTKYQYELKADGGDFAGWIQLNLGFF